MRRVERRLALLWEVSFLGYAVLFVACPGVLESFAVAKPFAIGAWIAVGVAWIALKGWLFGLDSRRRGLPWAASSLRRKSHPLAVTLFVVAIITPMPTIAWIALGAALAAVALTVSCDLVDAAASSR